MGYLTDGLTFNGLRDANLKRVTQFRDAKGNLSHPNGIEDWTPNDWLVAVTGEIGELANLLKKVHRGDYKLEVVKDDIANELADVQTYLDLLAARLNVNLGECTMTKFNEVSKRVKSNVRLDASGCYTYKGETS
jgi:NTP pyrophosphatase (non-canonical NTP hydrolase)